MRILIALSGLAIASFVIADRTAADKEQKVSMSDCPKAVQKTLKKEAGKGKIIDIDKERANGATIYVSEVRYGDLEYDIEIRKDGTLLSKALEGREKGKEEKEEESGEEDGEEESEENGETKAERMKKTDLPRKVQRTLKRESVGGKIEDIVKMQKDKKTVYGAEIELGKKDYGIEIAAGGTLLKKVLIDEESEGEEEKEEKESDKDD